MKKASSQPMALRRVRTLPSTDRSVKWLDDELARLFASDPETMRDPYPLYRRLHAEAPVYRHGPAVVVSRLEDIRTISAHAWDWIGAVGVPRQSAQAAAFAERLPHADDRRAHATILDFENLFMSRTDDRDRHDRLRDLAHRAFTPRRIEAMRPELARLRDELLPPLEPGEVADLAEFCYRLPLAAVASLLGVPHEDHALLHGWSKHLAASTWRDASRPETLHAAVEAIAEFRAYVEAVVERHRRAPGAASGLVAAMLDAEQDERASADELAAMFVNLLFAGHETTSNLIAIGIAELLRNHDQWELLAADPSLARTATEELLRYVSPTQFAPFDVLADFPLDDVTVHRGDTVIVMRGAGNRDPRVFADPDRLDLARVNSKEHLAFGFGPRYCLGQALARLEAELVFSTLPARYPRLEPATDRLEFQGQAMLRSLRSLPVTIPSRP